MWAHRNTPAVSVQYSSEAVAMPIRLDVENCSTETFNAEILNSLTTLNTVRVRQQHSLCICGGRITVVSVR